MNLKIMRLLIVTIIISLITFVCYAFTRKTDEEIKMDKWNKIGKLKIEMSRMEDSMKIKSAEKEKLLQEFNGVGETDEGK